MKYLLVIQILLFTAFNVQAQYTMQGKIEYERRMNLKRKLADMDDEDKRWMENVRMQIPKYTISFFDLYFNTAASVYKPGRETDSTVKMWVALLPAPENVVYTDFKSGSIKANKLIYDEKFLIQDSIRKLKWKITDEIRTIADYKCRKAVSKICDSVYVVAFYTEDITIPGGPEMFAGLPGMILEIAIPRLYTTWVAKKIDITAPKESELGFTPKGKAMNNQQMFDGLQKDFKRSGKNAQKNLWWCIL